MKFEEQFPSLNEKEVLEITYPSNDLRVLGGNLFSPSKEVRLTYHNGKEINLGKPKKEDINVYHIRDIKKHCLDKQRVKEAFQCAVFAIREMGRMAIKNRAKQGEISKLQEDRIKQIKNWIGFTKDDLE